MKNVVTYIIALFVFSSCQRQSKKLVDEDLSADSPKEESYIATSDPRSNEVEDRIRFAVTNFIFSKTESEDKRDSNFYFLQIDGDDPTKEFIHRFEGREPPVLPETRTKSMIDKGIFKDSEGRWLHFSLKEIKWISDTKVKVTWAKSETSWRDGRTGSRNASGHYATLTYDDQSWSVINDQTFWMGH